MGQSHITTHEEIIDATKNVQHEPVINRCVVSGGG